MTNSSATRRTSKQSNRHEQVHDNQRKTGRSKQRHGRGRTQTVRTSVPVLALLFSFSFLLTVRWRPKGGLWDAPLALDVASKTNISLFNSSLPAQVMLTTVGWNHPDPTIGRTVGRSMFQAGLNQGILDHPWYNPNGWQDWLSATTNGTQRRYVFLDVETCYEDNYPNYGWSLTANSDQEGGRPYLSSSGGRIRHLKNTCHIIDRVLDSPLFRQDGAVLIIFDCGTNGPPRWSCLNRETNPKLNQLSVSIVSQSAPDRIGIQGALDLGLPPPAIHPVPLTSSQQHDISSCQGNQHQRPFFFTFTGNFRSSVRRDLQQLHDPSNGIIVQHHFAGSSNTSSIGRGVHNQFANVNGSYTTLLSQSEFAGVPRGDNLYSYRFTEVMSGGGIPVVYSDGWVLPFSKVLIDWNTIAVIIPEREASRTLEYLRNLTMDDRCRMRTRGYEVYLRYLATPQGVIAGIIDSLELIRSPQ
jgi:Exostosin family